MTEDEGRMSDWRSEVCSSDLDRGDGLDVAGPRENSPANGRRENGLDNEFTARLLHDDSDVADRSAESARLLGKPSTQDPLLGEFGPECHASRSGSRKTLAPGREFIFGVQQPHEHLGKHLRSEENTSELKSL